MNTSKRQKQIIDVSIRLISEKGLDNLTTKNIAKEVGISEAGLYRHFDSKNAILVGILDFFEEQTRALLSGVAKEKKTNVEKIHSVLLKRIETFAANPALVILIFSEEIFQSIPIVSDKVFEILELNREYFAKFFHDGMKNGEFRNDLSEEQLFIFVMGTFRFIVLNWKLSRFQTNLVEKFNFHWQTVCQMITNS